MIIDLHTHLYPKVYLAALERVPGLPRVVRDAAGYQFEIFADEVVTRPDGVRPGRAMGPEYYGVGDKLRFMDDHRIDLSVVSVGNPWLDPFQGDAGVELARTLNDELEDMAAASHGRLLAYGVLPMTTVEQALTELSRIATHRHLVGISLGTRPFGTSLDDVHLEPLWGALAERKLIVFIHPHYGLGLQEMGGFGHILPVGIGFVFETTLAISRLVLAGVLRRHPALTLLAAHSGGTLPFVAARLDNSWRAEEDSVFGEVPPSVDLQRVFYDSLSYSPHAIGATLEFAGADHMVFGTDHPFAISNAAANVAAIEQLGKGQKDIFHGTASRLIAAAKAGR